VTVKQFISMIGEAETGGLPSEDARLRAIGDAGLAGGYYQQHWAWRVLDSIGLENYCTKQPGERAEVLADRYNLGHLDADPGYDKRCRDGLARLKIPASEYLAVVKD
jgi:hypothetical protein